MQRTKFSRLILVVCLLIGGLRSSLRATTLLIDKDAAPRVSYGASRLADALKAAGMQATVDSDNNAPADITVGKLQSPAIQSLINARQLDAKTEALKPEGFILATTQPKHIVIIGNDDSGELYGCLELAERVAKTHQLPDQLNFTDAPAFKLRGPCIGMQKTYILPGRHVYEYPYTPELFPFFYDKQFWQKYLDGLASNRMNTLYIWSGHPFASLVKLKDYPYALEVSEETFQKNVDMYRYIATEADKRGIWIVQNFYNIIVSQPFAEHNGIPTQLSAPTPLVADYTRKSVAEFVKQFPNVGVMFCLGEALQGIDNQIDWCTKVILPGVHDGMAEAHLTAEPPVIIRTHATDARIIVPEALKIYKNLYTEEKFNGESLTTWEPRGVREQLSLAMSKLGSTHITNIHILADLEPFRYGDQLFIKKCMIAARDRLGARGLHLYPLSFWNWPDSPDIANPPLKQWDRDWIWFQSWARYAWNPDIDASVDHAYWIDQMAEHYGHPAAENILAAYNDFGECAPRLLRRFGITEGNRQTLSLGMTLDELVNPEGYNPFEELWESQSPPGERLEEYAKKEWQHQPHEGETPPQIISEVLDYSKKAVDEIDAAAPTVTENKAEFERLQNDVHCIREMSESYCAKVNAAMLVLRYPYSHDAGDMTKAADFLAQSLDHYRQLAKLGDSHYQFANGMQTSQRQIPVKGGVDGKPANYLWSQLLPLYEKELSDFQKRATAIKNGSPTEIDDATFTPIKPASFTLKNDSLKPYRLKIGAKPFTDSDADIRSIAPELRDMVGIPVSDQTAADGHYQPIEFSSKQPVQVLIGYFNSPDNRWLKPPNLETDAGAVDRGSTEPLIRNALGITGLPPVDVYVEYYPAGQNKIDVHGDGSFIILGMIPRSTEITKRDAHRQLTK